MSNGKIELSFKYKPMLITLEDTDFQIQFNKFKNFNIQKCQDTEWIKMYTDYLTENVLEVENRLINSTERKNSIVFTCKIIYSPSKFTIMKLTHENEIVATAIALNEKYLPMKNQISKNDKCPIYEEKDSKKNHFLINGIQGRWCILTGECIKLNANNGIKFIINYFSNNSDEILQVEELNLKNRHLKYKSIEANLTNGNLKILKSIDNKTMAQQILMLFCIHHIYFIFQNDDVEINKKKRFSKLPHMKTIRESLRRLSKFSIKKMSLQRYQVSLDSIESEKSKNSDLIDRYKEDSATHESNFTKYENGKYIYEGNPSISQERYNEYSSSMQASIKPIPNNLRNYNSDTSQKLNFDSL
ncbi:hypothetical protein A3Q56_04167 [Intoshia linei]|uniref:Uncharacterized protein n=1 Tax=Intoshia linei TaxID=1819745 RepID=A0A177B1D7_9BILA|nr:hypothetical protein A3Q56_04167 [Intoshia linei]